MRTMHERHVKLMREMDENYKMIEMETQEYYLEFLNKWKEVARSKITQYRKTIESLTQEKEQLQRAKESEIEKLNSVIEELKEEKQKILHDYDEGMRTLEAEKNDEIERQKVVMD